LVSPIGRSQASRERWRLGGGSGGPCLKTACGRPADSPRPSWPTSSCAARHGAPSQRFQPWDCRSGPSVLRKERFESRQAKPCGPAFPLAPGAHAFFALCGPSVRTRSCPPWGSADLASGCALFFRVIDAASAAPIALLLGPYKPPGQARGCGPWMDGLPGPFASISWHAGLRRCLP